MFLQYINITGGSTGKKRNHKITRKKLKHKDLCLALLRNCTSNSAVRILTSKYTFVPLDVTPEMTNFRCGTLTTTDLNTGIQGYRNRCHQSYDCRLLQTSHSDRFTERLFKD